MRMRLFFLGLATVTATSVLACSGDDTNPPPSPPSDSGVDATTDGGDAALPDATTDAPSLPDGGDAAPTLADGGDAAPPNDAADAGDAEGPDAADAGDAGAVRASRFLASGDAILGVTSDGYVIYWTNNPADPANPELAAISVTGTGAQVLSTTTPGRQYAEVGGSTVVWLDTAGMDAGACPTPYGRAIRSWSSSRGTSLVAPYAIDYHPISEFGAAGSQANVAMSADGSKVAYVPGCIGDDAGGVDLIKVAVAPTDGTGVPLTAALPPPPAPDAQFWLYLNAATATMQWQFTVDGGGNAQVFSQEAFAGNPLALTIPNLPYLLTDPTGTWAWEPAAAGRNRPRQL